VFYFSAVVVLGYLLTGGLSSLKEGKRKFFVVIFRGNHPKNYYWRGKPQKNNRCAINCCMDKPKTVVSRYVLDVKFFHCIINSSAKSILK